MPSSRNTTKNPTADQLYEEVTRRLKTASSNIAKRKLESGEYVMHNGRIIPASVLEEANAENAISKRKRHGAIPSLSIARKSAEARPLAPIWIGGSGQNNGGWKGSRKSVAAASVQTSIRHPMRVRAAALFNGETQSVDVHIDHSGIALKDGQIFAYDAKSGQFIPVMSGGGKMIQRNRRDKGRKHAGLLPVKKSK
ncbi:hypothetical protein [Siccibacter turicensis]|uniref:hypothetical protein n=1 Tax=Siccibacter turicensis TaxID=357233 RepID=UPI0011B21520|nr:hypothetical protein [Siccibacter turicensis]